MGNHRATRRKFTKWKSYRILFIIKVSDEVTLLSVQVHVNKHEMTNFIFLIFVVFVLCVPVGLPNDVISVFI